MVKFLFGLFTGTVLGAGAAYLFNKQRENPIRLETAESEQQGLSFEM